MVSDSRNGIYRSVVAAIAGLILVGASSPSPSAINAKESNGAEAKQQKPPQANLVSPIPAKTQSQDNGCEQGQDKRNSDLCAQWKAADAAADAAQWAWIQLIGAGIGLLLGGATMAAAISAAYYAKRAANETKRSADIATKAYSDQINSTRPLLMVDQSSFELWASPDESGFNDGHKPPFQVPVRGFRLKFVVRNFGQSPCWIESIWFGFSPSDDFEPKPPALALQFRDAIVGFIAPNQKFDVGDAIYLLSGSDLEKINSQPSGIEITGLLQYRAPAGHIFSTEFGFHVSIGDHTKSAVPIGDKRCWRDGRVKAVKLLIDDPIEYLDDT